MNYKELRRHIGHNIVCVGYALKDEKGNRKSHYENVAIECETCNEVLISFDKPLTAFNVNSKDLFNSKKNPKLSLSVKDILKNKSIKKHKIN